MKSISSLLEEPKHGRFQTPPNSARAEQVSEVCMMMDGDYKRFPYWLGRTNLRNVPK
jgi:hypothetical protein